MYLFIFDFILSFTPIFCRTNFFELRRHVYIQTNLFRLTRSRANDEAIVVVAGSNFQQSIEGSGMYPL